jgi:5-methylcytosine-specific restriction endonuclease McrA
MHPYNYKCTVGKIYQGGAERKERSKYKWTKKSEEIREKANYLCEVCRDKGTYTYNDLEVHHITKVREDKDKLLDNYNLICLCVKHHKQADRGELDKDYLLNLARKREDT